MKPRLLHVFATFVAGGPQVRTARLIAGLGPGWRHAIVALDGRTDARELLPDGVEVELLPQPAPGGTLASVRRCAQLVTQAAPDLVLTYNWGAIEAAAAARLSGHAPLIHHEDGFNPDEVEGFKLRRVWTRRLVLPGAHAVVVPSRTLLEIATESWHLSESHVRWIPNGIRTQDFPERDGNPELRAELGIPYDACVVGACGHLRPEKNPVRLVEALARVECDEEVHLLVLGDGPERLAVESAARLGGIEGRVHLVGHRPEPQPYYRAMDVFGLSSDTEQMPVALLEAMACALPVVATDVGDVADVLPPAQARFVVPTAGEPTEPLAAALGALLTDRVLAAELGRGNRARVEERFGFDGMLAAYRSLFEAALGRAVPA